MAVLKRVKTAGGAPLIVAVLAAGAYFRMGATEASVPSVAAALPLTSASAVLATDVPILVEGTEVVVDTLVLAVSASGQAAAWQRVVVTAEVPGRVATVAVRESNGVARGEVLVTLDPVDRQLALDEVRTFLREAERNYRERLLFDGDLPEAVRQERDAAARLWSGLDRAEIQFEKAELDLERTRIRAPFGGRVADLAVVPGQWVGQGTELLSLVDLDPIRVQVRVLEGEIAHVAPGGSAEIRFGAFPGTPTMGTVATLNPVVEQQTRTARVTVVVPNPGGRVLPGMYARVRLEARRLPGRLLVPRESVLERDRRTLVFVAEGGRAAWRYVATGLENDTHIEIVESPEADGLAPGEVVLTRGHFSLTHDAPIRLVTDLRQ